jgi:hypothetical protein
MEGGVEKQLARSKVSPVGQDRMRDLLTLIEKQDLELVAMEKELCSGNRDIEMNLAQLC